MPESRESTLPSGMSDLVEMINQRDRESASKRLTRFGFRIACHKLAVCLLPQLARTIDHDLLFTDQPELVMRLLREAAREAVKPIANDQTEEEMVDMVANEIRRLIACERTQRKNSP
jgi:hypothetical protein